METGAVKYTHGSKTVETDLNDSSVVSPVNPSSGSSTSPPESLRGNDYFRSRIWMIAAITLFVVSVALLVSLVLKESNHQVRTSPRVAGRVVLKQPSDQDILAAFGDFFRTEDEQRKFEKQIKKMNRDKTRTPVDTIVTPWNCSFQCFDQFGRVKPADAKWTELVGFTPHQLNDFIDSELLPFNIQQPTTSPIVDRVYNGCCISEATYISPANATSYTGKNVTLVQMEHNRQYFPYENCRQQMLCQGCTCDHQITYTSAVVKNTTSRSVYVDSIKLDGCCKCFNT